MANNTEGPTYITSTQLAVVETLLVGLRKRCVSDFYTTFLDGYLKVASTQVLHEAGYTTLEFLDLSSQTATLLSQPETSAKPEATPGAKIGPKVREKTDRDVITHKPFVHFELRCFSEISNGATDNNDLERGIERLISSNINALVVACSTQVYTSYQEQYTNLLVPAAKLQSFFSDSEQRYTGKHTEVISANENESENKNGEEEEAEEGDSLESEGESSSSGQNKVGEEFILRACRIVSPTLNVSRVVFAIFRPNTLKKQVERLLRAKSKLEREKADMQEDHVTLAAEVESLKQEVGDVANDRDTIHVGKGEFEAAHDLMREERDEARIEVAALKDELAELRKEIHTQELELEAFREASNKKLLLSDDESDVGVSNVDAKDESIELDGDESDTETPLATNVNLENEDSSEDELEKVAPPKIESDSDSDSSEKHTKVNKIVVEDDNDSNSDVSLELDEPAKADADKSNDDLKLDSDSDSEGVVLLSKNEPKHEETKKEDKKDEVDDDEDSDWSDG